MAYGITVRHRPHQARLILIDYYRSLLDAVDTEYRIGYVASLSVVGSLLSDACEALLEQLPTASLPLRWRVVGEPCTPGLRFSRHM